MGVSIKSAEAERKLRRVSRLLGKSEAENRQFLQTPRFVARIEVLGPPKKK